MGLTNAQYDEIMREYDRKRIDARHRLDARAAQVYEMIPEYSDVEDEIREIAVECGIKSIGGDENALDDMKRRIEELSSVKAELLVSHGFSPDYLEPEYECEDCMDTGYIGQQKCHCLTQKILQMLYSKSNVGDILMKENFDNIDIDQYSDMEYEKMGPIIQKCKNYVANFDNEYENLLFIGKPGVGKTFLSNCIAKALLDSGHSVIYFTSVQLFDTLSTYAFSYDYSENSLSMKEDISSCDLLIIDDLGTEMTNSFVSSHLFNIINEREIRNKATIISTNLDIESISERYSERVLSRLVGKYTGMRLDISDIRFKNRILGQGK